MAEALAVVGLVAAIVQIIDFGSRVIGRLNEFQSDTKDVPKILRDLKIRLPLLVNTLGQTKEQAESAPPDDETARALKSVVDGCLSQIRLLEDILTKDVPTEKDSSLRKRLKALWSLAHDKDVQKITTALEGYIQTLTYYTSSQTLHTSVQQMKLGSDLPSRKPVFMVKFDQDPDFIGRENVLKEIDERHRKGRYRVAIAGSLGLQSSIVTDTERDNPRHMCSGCMPATVPDSRKLTKTWPESLLFPATTKPKFDTLQLALKYLSDDAHGSWLLVLDNADDSEIFFQSGPQSGPLVNCLPKSSKGSTIITTRDMRVGESLANREKPIAVLPLQTADAESLLQSKVPGYEEGNKGDSLELLETLNHLPLAITQAAAFISENGITVTDYVKMLQASDSDIKDLLEEDLHDPGRDSDIQNSVFKTWKLTFDQISKKKPRAAEILALMSLLDRQAISTELLRNEHERTTNFVTAIGTLKAFSLVSEEKSGSVLSIHRLVQLSTQKWLEAQNQLEHWQGRAVDAVFRCCPYNAEYEEWANWENILPHCQIVLGYTSCSSETCRLQRAHILHGTGTYDRERGRYQVSAEKLGEALAIRKELLETDHEDTLETLFELAWTYWDLDEFKKAMEMEKLLVRTRTRVCGPEHESTLVVMNNLAMTYLDQERWKEAEELQVAALEAQKKQFALNHLVTATILHNLAHNYMNQRRWKEAEELQMQALKMRTIMLGLKHSETLASMHNLACLYRSQERNAEAVDLMRQIVALRTEVLGTDHPGTQRSVGMLNKWKDAPDPGQHTEDPQS